MRSVTSLAKEEAAVVLDGAPKPHTKSTAVWLHLHHVADHSYHTDLALDLCYGRNAQMEWYVLQSIYTVLTVRSRGGQLSLLFLLLKFVGNLVLNGVGREKMLPVSCGSAATTGGGVGGTGGLDSCTEVIDGAC